MHHCDQKSRFTCDWIFNQLVVLCDGKVVCGCADPYGERPLGHLQQESLLSIWNSPLAQEIRQGLNQGHSCFCDSCGLKRPLAADEPPPQGPLTLEKLPRIFFEPTVLCNLSCFQAVCHQESGILQTRSRLQFPYTEFKSLMADVGQDLQRIDLFNYGDPFVHPEAVSMAEHIKANFPHIYLYISTNGLMLDRGKISRLVAARVDEITFSVDGPDQETYSRYRQGGDFKKVFAIMEQFVNERDGQGWEVPYINWRYILFKWNDSARKMAKTRKLARQIGIDRLTWEITDHPAAAMSKKYQPGTKHWQRIFHEIWDSSQIGNAIKNNRYLAKISITEKKIEVPAGRKLTLKVQVKNRGGALWRKTSISGRRIVRLGAQLFDQQKNLLELNHARAFLNKPLAGSDADTIAIELPPYPTIGLFWLKFDMVLEGIDWFEANGSAVTWIPHEVTGRDLPTTNR